MDRRLNRSEGDMWDLSTFAVAQIDDGASPTVELSLATVDLEVALPH
jgi:hypothetical protein